MSLSLFVSATCRTCHFNSDPKASDSDVCIGGFDLVRDTGLKHLFVSESSALTSFWSRIK